MSKIVTGSFGMALQPIGASAASNPGDEYKQCQDPEIMAGNIAAGPFCNIIYGIPPEYLDKDPVAIVNNLVDKNEDGSDNTGPYAGNVDSETGDPIPNSDLAKWIDLCTDGTTDEAANCMLSAKNVHDKPEIVDFALYTIDHRIQKSMDEDETTTTASSTPTSTTPTPSTGDAQQLAKEILANNKIDLSYVGSAGVSPKDDVEAAAEGKVGTAGVMTDARILQLIAAIGQNHSVQVTAIQSGGTGHCGGKDKAACPDDPHYIGKAVDIDKLDGSPVQGRNGPSITIIKIAENTWTGGRFGQSTCPGSTAPLPNGWITFPDTCNHLHLDVVGTP
jgi:hypothetical protein